MDKKASVLKAVYIFSNIVIATNALVSQCLCQQKGSSANKTLATSQTKQFVLQDITF